MEEPSAGAHLKTYRRNHRQDASFHTPTTPIPTSNIPTITTQSTTLATSSTNTPIPRPGPLDPTTEIQTHDSFGRRPYNPIIDLPPVRSNELYEFNFPIDDHLFDDPLPPVPRSALSRNENHASDSDESMLDDTEGDRLDETHRAMAKKYTAAHAGFLDLEAAVAGEDEEDEEEDEEMATFLDDDAGEDDADEALSHALVETGPLTDDWNALLARARGRAQTSVSAKEKYDYDASFQTTKGCEEAVAFALMNKCLSTESSHGIQSVIGHRSRPGWVYIEAPIHADVRRFVQGVSKVHQYQQILAVPHEDSLSCLRGAPPFIPPANSWVRLTRPPLYKNDIAYVLKYDPQYGAKAFVVPRVSLSPTSTSKSRPPQSLLHLDEVLKTLPAKTQVLRESPSKFKFKTHLYLEGYRCLSTFDIVPGIPTEAELNFFIDSSHVTTESVAFAQHHIASSRLQIKDRVLVTRGHTKGVVGLISDLRDDSATILTTHYPPKPIDVPRADLRKAFRVGDEVIVVAGPKQRTVGWVVSLTPSTLTIYSNKSDEEFEIAVSNANFYTAPQVFLNPTSQPPVAGTSSAYRLPFSHDPLHHLKGQEVTVTGANPFKGLEARVKETRNDGQVIVEVAANLRNVVVDPKNLSTRDFQPVPGPSHQYSPAVPLSTLALTASVPLPSTLAPASGSQYT
ncbi:hypothetical protein H0H93_005867, partial [Arthromyces matolae]